MDDTAIEIGSATEAYWKSFIALEMVWITPHARGIPTNPHARASFIFIELSVCVSIFPLLRLLPLLAERPLRRGHGRADRFLSYDSARALP